MNLTKTDYFTALIALSNQSLQLQSKTNIRWLLILQTFKEMKFNYM